VKTELVSVNPQLAREWLKKNTKNRAIRPSHVETLRQSFERGEQVTTHQGIAFDTEGFLIDGQHRLAAIAQMCENFSFCMLVTWGLDREKAFQVIDAVQAKRSTSDVLMIDRDIGGTATFLASIYKGTRKGITPLFVAPFASFVQPEFTELVSFCNTVSKTWSSSPVRAAAILHMKNGNIEHTKKIYRAMVLSDFEGMPTVARSVFKAYIKGTVRADGGTDIFARCMKMYEPGNANLQRIQINSVSESIGQARATLDEMMFNNAKKKAPAVEREAKRTVYKQHSSSHGL
jgi:hypothetical protein